MGNILNITYQPIGGSSMVIAIDDIVVLTNGKSLKVYDFVKSNLDLLDVIDSNGVHACLEDIQAVLLSEKFLEKE